MLAPNRDCTSTLIYFSELVTITQGTVIAYTKDSFVNNILLDSRVETATRGAIFFAIPGQNHDGHQYITEFYKKGVRQFVVMHGESETYTHLEGVNIIKVAHSITALHQIATYYRNKFTIPVVAITGSNGKTMVKEWLSELLGLQYTIIKSPSSYNSQIGVPISITLINPTHQYAIFEAGISLPNEMERLEAIIQPQAGIFTNIGTAHDEGFTSQQQKIEEKVKLFMRCKRIYYCADHTTIEKTLTKLCAHKVALISWSLHNSQATYYIQKIKEPNTHQTRLLVIKDAISHYFHIPFQNNSLLENIIHCIVYALHEGIAATKIQDVVATLHSVPMRLTMKLGIKNCQIIDDSYNNDLTGLKVALAFMSQQCNKYNARKTVILSDLLQTNITSETLYAQLNNLLKEQKVTRLIGIGEHISAHAAHFSMLETTFYKNTTTLLQEDLYQMFYEELILIKGARKFSLEKVVAKLQYNMHSTVLEINLDAIRHNLGFFRNQLNRKTKIMVMVKASAYGSSFELAQLLQYQCVNYLAVAYTDEGVRLREYGITLPIMVMNPTTDSFDKIIDYQLEPEIYSLPLLRSLIHFLEQQQVEAKIHLKLETGFYRLGIEETVLNSLISLLSLCPYIKVASIFSHLVGSESTLHDQYTENQAFIFKKLVCWIENKLSITTIKHLLNTNGILRFPQYQWDMVRLGIGLYGVGIAQEVTKYLIPAHTLKTVISQIKSVPKGTTIGYDRRGIANTNKKIATIAIGYADGFSRILSNGVGTVWVNGHQAPVIGNVCMDMAMVDVTHIDVAVGDEVIIFGRGQPIEEFAQSASTIPHEILTNVSERIKRVYYV